MGGGVAQAFGWRATFIAIIIIAGVKQVICCLSVHSLLLAYLFAPHILGRCALCGVSAFAAAQSFGGYTVGKCWMCSRFSWCSRWHESYGCSVTVPYSSLACSTSGLNSSLYYATLHRNPDGGCESLGQLVPNNMSIWRNSTVTSTRQVCSIGTCMLAGAIILPLLIFGVPETHQYKNLVRLASKDPREAAAVKEAPQILARTPQFQAPWYPFQLLLDRREAHLGSITHLLFLCSQWGATWVPCHWRKQAVFVH